MKRITERDARPILTLLDLQQLRDASEPKSPNELLDELVLWLGSHTPKLGAIVDVTYPKFKSILGVCDAQGFDYMTHWVSKSLWFTARDRTLGPSPRPVEACSLSPAGWDRFKTLQQVQTEERTIFMAMNYGNAEMDSLVDLHFRGAVNKTGFTLRRLDENQGAGLIDDQLRVAIRRSRLLICDLTHGNKGAYWEAGFAEGLGKPVIYTCRRDVFVDQQDKNHPHFDTNHLVTVPWSHDDLADAAKRLTATIRATLPLEATLTDDESTPAG